MVCALHIHVFVLCVCAYFRKELGSTHGVSHFLTLLQHNYTCSFLATQRDLFFVKFTASTWEDNECCLFSKVSTDMHTHKHTQ